MNEKMLIALIRDKYPIPDGSSPQEITQEQQRAANVIGRLFCSAHRKGRRKKGAWTIQGEAQSHAKNPSAILTAACSLVASAGYPLGVTSFNRLSEQAQELIVRAVIGEFNDASPPEIPESVKAEIAQWVSEPDAENL